MMQLKGFTKKTIGRLAWMVVIMMSAIVGTRPVASAATVEQLAAQPNAAAQTPLTAQLSTTAAQTVRPLIIKKNIPNTWQLKSSTFDGMEVKTTMGRIDDVQTIEVEEQGSFLSLNIEGYVLQGEIGRPALPCQIKIIEIPQEAVPVVEILRDKIEITDLSAYRQNGQTMPLYPMQESVSKGAKTLPSFAYNKQVYQMQGYHAHELVKIEIMGESRGVRLAKVIVSPVEYDPLQHRLKIHTDLDFEIRFDGADYEATQAKKKRYTSQGFRMAENIGINAAAMQIQQSPAATKAKKVENDRPLRYAIVSDPKFKEPLQRFITWKKQQGFDVVEAYTDEANVGKTNESIRTYLKGLYDQASDLVSAPTYVLLVGDEDEIPPFDSKLKMSTSVEVPDPITDLYFVEYTGDKLPDAFLGRFSATTVEELTPQIEKTIYMSTLAEEDAAFVDTTLLVAGNDSRFNLSHLNPPLRYIQAYATAEEGVKALLFEAPASSTPNVEDEIIRRISSGAGLICYTGHGLSNEWCEPQVSTAVLKNKIFNKNKYPMMVGNCCLTGRFNYGRPCLGEELLRQSDKGAVVYIGATNNSYFEEDFYWMVGLTKIVSGDKGQYTYQNTGFGAFDAFYHTHGEAFEKWAVTASDMIYYGNMAVEASGSKLNNYYWEIYSVFGDPSYRPYKKKPTPAPIECAKEIAVGMPSLSVMTVPYAQLSLYDADNKVVGVTSAMADGQADLPTEGVKTGNYRLHAGASGYTDSEITIKAVNPEGKFVFVESAKVYDGEEAVENGIYGKRYALTLKLNNIGTEAVNKIQIKLSSSEKYFVAEEAYTHTLSCAPGETLTLDKKIFFSLSPNVPNHQGVYYRVELTLDDAAEPITRTFSFQALASDMRLLSAKLDDSKSANPNNVLDEGETVKVTLRLYNAGSVPARDVKATFASEKHYLILPETAASWGDIAPGDTIEKTFELSAKSGEFRYDVYTVVCKMNADGREQEAEWASYIGPVVETFESGNFNFVQWDKKSDWVISDSVPHGGKYCAASRLMGDRDTSRLKFTVNVLLDDEVGFYYRTSTEGMNAVLGDFLMFLIDGKMQGRWNRENDWTYAHYPVTAGEHTLEWLYVKDASSSAGADRVWIDDVRLPIGSHSPMTPNECPFGLKEAENSLFAVIGQPGDELRLHFNATKADRGRLYIVNALGETVKTLAQNWQVGEGESDAVFNIADLNQGLYICVFEGKSCGAASCRAAVKFIKH